MLFEPGFGGFETFGVTHIEVEAGEGHPAVLVIGQAGVDPAADQVDAFYNFVGTTGIVGGGGVAEVFGQGDAEAVVLLVADPLVGVEGGRGYGGHAADLAIELEAVGGGEAEVDGFEGEREFFG